MEESITDIIPKEYRDNIKELQSALGIISEQEKILNKHGYEVEIKERKKGSSAIGLKL